MVKAGMKKGREGAGFRRNWRSLGDLNMWKLFFPSIGVFCITVPRLLPIHALCFDLDDDLGQAYPTRAFKLSFFFFLGSGHTGHFLSVVFPWLE